MDLAAAMRERDARLDAMTAALDAYRDAVIELDHDDAQIALRDLSDLTALATDDARTSLRAQREAAELG